MYLFKLWFSPDRCSGVRLLDHMACCFYCWLSSWFCNSETQKTYLKCNLEIGQNRVDDTCREIVVGKKMLGSVFEGQTENQAQRPEFVLHVIGSL